MSEVNIEKYLVGTLKKLEDSARKMVETRGYTKELEHVRALQEMIKEQLKNENTRTTARPIR